MLHLNHLKKSFGRNEILTDVEYTFEEGNIYPVLGGAGAGRTTLFECIAGDIPVDSGTVETKEKCTLFFAAKQSVLPMLITGYQFISMLCDMNKNSEKPEYYLDKVKLTGLIRDRHIGDYSFEEKKRLQLAAFLIQKPYVMMFDEALDYCTDEYVDDMLSVLNEVKNEHIILISTGVLDVAHRISQDVVVLNNGELNQISYETMQIPEIKGAVLDILGEADNETSERRFFW